MAAPHVSGMVATIIGLFPPEFERNLYKGSISATSGNLPPAQMRAKIMSMATRRFVKPENYPTSSIVTFDPSFFAT
jgi:subtilisin family serine protease